MNHPRGIVNDEEENLLKQVYYDVGNPASYGGVSRLVKISNIPRKKVNAWLKSQRTYTTHHPVRKRYPTRKYVTRGLDHQWQADLVEMRPYAKQNLGYHYLLTVIDMFSRYAWARPLKRKTPEEVMRAFSEIFEKDGRQPRYLQTDEGTEFENRKVRAFLQSRGIEQFSVKSQFKAAMVERLNRTLKTKMWRVFTHRGNYQWLDILDDLVKAYNHSQHRTIGCKPSEVNKSNEVKLWLHQYGKVKKAKRKSKFQVGERVRISKVKGLFEKGYLPNWSEEIFTVASINRKYHPMTYQLKDFRGEIIEGSFYDYELQAVDDSDQLYTVERIIRTRGKGKHKQYLVKWLGYDETSWINQSDFQQLT